jgi:RNA polymerase sigma-70 factor (ECF subfamily)
VPSIVHPQAPQKVEQWIAAARNGSREALGQLLEACRQYLLLVANQELPANLRAKVGASDLVQDTCAEAQRDFGQFQGLSEPDLVAWLRRILRNNVANVSRHYYGTDKRQLALEVPLSAVPSGELAHARIVTVESPSELAQAREQSAALERALQQLSEHHRQVIVWRNRENRSFGEIGRLLGRSHQAARKLWARAIEHLQEIVASYESR